MFDVVIQAGHVVTPDGGGQWDVGIADGRVAAISARGALDSSASRVIDATGKLVIPGGVDPHVHAAPVGFPTIGPSGQQSRQALPPQISKAALHGGTTTLLDFAVWSPGLTIAKAIESKESYWKDAYSDYALHVLLRGQIPREVIEEIPESISAGYPSFKVFMTDTSPGRAGQMMVSLGQVNQILQNTGRHGGILALHAEDDDLVMSAYDNNRYQGRTALKYLPDVHSPAAEDVAVRRLAALLKHTSGAAIYIMHLSSAAAVEAVAEARSQGLPVYGETLHHFVTYTAEVYERPEGALFHTYPSLKHEPDIARLWSAMSDGTISAVGTDEACHPREVKIAGQTIFDAVGGHSGVETRLAVIYTEGVVKRGLPVERFVALTSSNAAKLFGLYPQKGAITVGSDADIVIFDPNSRRTLQASDLHATDYSIWDGFIVEGWPTMTLLRGKVVVDNGTFCGEAGMARPVLRKISSRLQLMPML